MKIKDKYTIISNTQINKNDTFEMKVIGNTSAIKNPGEFVEAYIPGVYLPRPFSIAYHDENQIGIVYKVVGDGTKIMAIMKPKEKIELLTGCGNGFDLTVDTKKPLLIGGGTGSAPLYDLALALAKKGIDPTILIGFRTYDDIVYGDIFKDKFNTLITIEENEGKKYAEELLVTDELRKLTFDDYDYFYACGPKGMLKAVSDIALTDGEVSLESRMACGIGQCKCCSIETSDGMKTLCKDGPVLKKRLVRW